LRGTASHSSSATTKLLKTAAITLVAGCLAIPETSALTPVDLELQLLVDVSGSVDATEFGLQQTGYVNAFNNAALVSAIQSGAIGSIAAQLIYWSSAGSHAVAVDWMHISDAASATAFATAVGAAARTSSGLTGLGEVLDFGKDLFSNNLFDGTRWVMDVSGDGENNDGLSAAAGRDAALAAGVDTINGLVIITPDFPNLETYYQNNVIGGVNAFVEVATDFSSFGDAISRKLIREARPPTVPDGGSTAALLGWAFTGLFWAQRKALQ
jgi:hypothetical protein